MDADAAGQATSRRELRDRHANQEGRPRRGRGRSGVRTNTGPIRIVQTGSHPRTARRTIASLIFTALTMVAVTLMAFATSVPANALLSSDDVNALRTIAAANIGDQELQAFDASGDVVNRDGYGSEAAPPSVLWPVAKRTVSDGFGYRDSPCSGCSSMHQGTDFTGGLGAPITAIADGTVLTVIESSGGLGVHVIVQHEIDGQMLTSVYGHMQFGSVGVVEGQQVKAGDFIGLLGNTGDSTGPHLHFELRMGGTTAVDAFVWLSEHAAN